MEDTLHANAVLTPAQRFWRLLKPDQREITHVYIYSIFNGLVNLSLPLGIQAIINLIQGGTVSASWILLVALVVAGVAATGYLQIAQLRITENLQQKVFARAAFEFAYRIPRIRMEALYKHYAPELMNRFFDTISVQKGFSKILIDFSAATLQVIFGLLLLAFYHPFFIGFGLVLIVLVYALFQFTGPKGLKTSLKESKHKYAVAHWLEELARTHTTFKLAGKTDLSLNKMNDTVEEYLDARDSHFKVLVRQYSLLVVFKVLVATGLLAIGGMLVMEQHMNIGQFVAAEIIILIVMQSVEKLVMSLETIYDVLTSLEKIGQVTDLELESDKGIDLQDHCHENGVQVELKNVDFTYPDSEHMVLKNMTLSIGSGEKILIAGANGSGKSTLLHVIAGLYRPQRGMLAYNNLNQGSLDLASLREVIGDCLSQEQLFNGTVEENISLGREAATFQRVKWASEQVMLEHFVNQLPQGYQTVLHPEGQRLPRSIVQRILLARAIAAGPRLLLLEDALEHVEATDKKQIIDNLTAPDTPWTLVAVSQDKYLGSKADRLVLMSDGTVEAEGDYDQMKRKIKFNTIDHA